jgi:uncharacterized protein (DUF1684 family)
MKQDKIMSALRKFRKEKDDFFAKHPDSPLTHDQKHDFQGLHYFAENTDLIFEVAIKAFPRQETVEMQTSTGEIQPYQRYGKIKFNVEGKTAELTIYSSEGGYFLPFVDAMAGKETYGAGRYVEPLPLENGKLLIDFNYAYNPYCAYNARWSCPIPPAENRIKVAIRAGEKIFSSH